MSTVELLITWLKDHGAPTLLILLVLGIVPAISAIYTLIRDSRTYTKEKLELLQSLLKEHPQVLGADLTVFRNVISAHAFAIATNIKTAKKELRRRSWMELHALAPDTLDVETLAKASRIVGSRGEDPQKPLWWGMHIALVPVLLLYVTLYAAIILLGCILIYDALKQAPLLLLVKEELVIAIYLIAAKAIHEAVVGPYFAARRIAAVLARRNSMAK